MMMVIAININTGFIDGTIMLPTGIENNSEIACNEIGKLKVRELQDKFGASYKILFLCKGVEQEKLNQANQ